MRNEELLELIGLIYDATLDQERWPAFLTRLADVIGSEGTVLVSHSFQPFTSSISAGVRMDPFYQREYNEYYSQRNIWTIQGLEYLKPGLVYTGEMACEQDEFEQSEFYHDFLRRFGVYHGIGGTIEGDGQKAAFVSSVRGQAAGPFQDEHIALFETLVPHLRRALAIHHRFTALAADRSGLAAVLDRLSLGGFLINGRGRVIYTNQAGQAMIDRQDGVRLTRGALQAAGQRDDTRLRQLIAGAIETAQRRSAQGGGVLRLFRPSGAQSYVALVAPLTLPMAELSLERAMAMVLVTDPAELPPSPEVLLRQSFGLSPAEARLAVALFGSDRLAEAADSLGISLNTAKTHLSRIFAKTGTHRQAQLQAVLRSLAQFSDGSHPNR